MSFTIHRAIGLVVLLVAGCRSSETAPPGKAGPAAPLVAGGKSRVELATGITMAFREGGDPAGQSVVLLHGLTDTSRSFLPLMGHLADVRPDLHLYALDLRGHGDSSMPAGRDCRVRPEECFRPEVVAAEVVAFLHARGVERTYLVGHSFGSVVAQEIALRHPELVDRLVLIASSGRFAGTAVVEQFLLGDLIEGRWKEALAREGRRWPEDAFELLPRDADPEAAAWMLANWVADPVADPAYLAQILPETLRTPIGTWLGGARALNHHDNVERLKELPVPTLVLGAARDTMSFESPDQEASRASLDAAPVRSFFKEYGKRKLPASGMQEDELGHNLHWGAPREVALDLAAFLRPGGEPTPDLYHASAEDVRRVDTTRGAARIVVLGGP